MSVGDEDDLQAFLKHKRDHLATVRTVFLRSEEVRIDAAIEREEALEMEHAEGFNAPRDQK